MTYQERKMIMRAKARLANGLVNLLKDDTEQMCIDAEDFNVFGLGESIREGKQTAHHLIDTLCELERELRAAKRDA